MVTAHGALEGKRGWLLRLEGAGDALGWGEAAPLAAEGAQPDGGRPDGPDLEAAIRGLGETIERSDLELAVPGLPLPLAFAVGSALAELEGWPAMDGRTLQVRGVESAAPEGGWLSAPASAVLLPAGAAMPEALEGALASGASTVKWKVASAADRLERELLERLLGRLPAAARLRLDANGGWDRPTAFAWAQRLVGETRLDWLEQPLPPSDQSGLEALAAQVPVALDESLRAFPELRSTWAGWQVRRPALEGDPRPFWLELRQGAPRRMLSTALETGLGQRLVAHLAALQAGGPTPTAPGLAPGWCPGGPLFESDPARVWEAAA
ncbi:enolase C-terminal domain-like protein [Cyanobium sp. Morenito 9A2]|uniref:enolase C-terminal domain-like protein n=1 Tax=Cyanobium sp. Morenito 9A2 TaxID=2823718 RepID=UPI0020CEC1F4|nr:enolase C-terminal domain-like protein [Cyanobium sp. Morenito 9A2]MCP9849973.1 o-succinylbenzoate synthase [Cyanobium sp. Morenito 9A2]